MKKSFYYTTMLVAALVMLWSCSSSDDDENEEKQVTSYTETPATETPEWIVDWTANDAAPDWKMPEASVFENWSILMVKLQPELASYATDDDMMAVFINDNLRAAAQPAASMASAAETGDDSVFFILKVYGNDVISNKTQEFTLKYYSNHFHQMFSLTGQEKFVPERVYGVDEDFIPPLTTGSTKYPVVMNLDITPTIKQDSTLNFSADDLLAVFVGDECRGVYSAYNGLISQPVSMTVYGKQEGEAATVRYYNAQKKAVLSFKETFSISGGEKTFNINF